MNFHVGQRVVCIDDEWVGGLYWRSCTPNRPQKNLVYTIRDLHVSLLGHPGLRLEEIINPVSEFAVGYFVEPGFRQWHFRPVRTTSIECFTKLLIPTKDEELV